MYTLKIDGNFVKSSKGGVWSPVLFDKFTDMANFITGAFPNKYKESPKSFKMSFAGFPAKQVIIKFDSDGNPLVAGKLYCMINDKPDFDKNGNETGETYESYGATFWYGSNGEFYDSEDSDFSDISHYEYDRLALQACEVNHDYV